MARYRMDDGTIIDTSLAGASWAEERDWDGNNHVSRVAGKWGHQTLFRSRKGRYYVEHRSDWQGTMPHVEWVSPEEAARWLLLNEHELPSDLSTHEAEVIE